MILGESAEEKQALKMRILQVCRARREVVIHGCTSFLKELHKPAFYEHLPTQIVYLCCEAKTLHWLTDPTLDVTDEPDDKQKKNCHIILATRLLGGYVCGASWLDFFPGNDSGQSLPASCLGQCCASRCPCLLAFWSSARLPFCRSARLF